MSSFYSLILVDKKADEPRKDLEVDGKDYHGLDLIRSSGNVLHQRLLMIQVM